MLTTCLPCDTSFLNVTSKSILVIDFQLMKVMREGKEIYLTKNEYELLVYLWLNKNKPRTRKEILEVVWGIDYDPETNVVDVYINYLRKKIDKPFNKNIVLTKVGTGYYLSI